MADWDKLYQEYVQFRSTLPDAQQKQLDKLMSDLRKALESMKIVLKQPRWP